MYNFISITLNMAIVSVRQRAFLVGMAFLLAAAWFGISLFTVTECSWVKQFLSGMPGRYATRYVVLAFGIKEATYVALGGAICRRTL